MDNDLKKWIGDGLFVRPGIWHDKTLSVQERLYLALREQYAAPQADALFMACDTKKRTLSNVKKSLLSKNKIHFEKLTPEKAKEQTIKNSHKGFTCEWCGQESYLLHKHHYPISAKDGGKEIVNICPNCHYTFHKLMGYATVRKQ